MITFENLKKIASELGETMTDDELKLMISEANGGDKTFTVTEEQFAQVLTRATNLWFAKLWLYEHLYTFIY